MGAPMLIGFPKLGKKLTLSGGAWQSAYPLSNALSHVYARVARSINASNASTKIIATSPDRQPVRLIGIFAHNMNLNAAFQITCFDSTGGTDVLLWQSEVELVWRSVYDTSTRPFETENWWTGQYSDDERAGQIPSRPVILPEGISPSKILIEFFVESILDVGLLEIASAIELGFGERPEHGATWGFESKTTVLESEGGLQRSEVFAPSYVFSGTIPMMSNVKARQSLSELFRQLGEHTPFMWVPFQNDTTTLLRESKMVTNQPNALLSFVSHKHMSVPLNLKEWKG
jgi:hypothetical protein